jgi:hypothetical protein
MFGSRSEVGADVAKMEKVGQLSRLAFGVNGGGYFFRPNAA